MSLLPLIVYPDPRLLERAIEIRAFDSELEQLARDMVETMEAARGCGLAAPQVGVGIRLIVFNFGASSVGVNTLRVMANPQVTWESEDESSWPEECLSCPGVKTFVTRPKVVDVRWDTLDPRRKGKRCERFRGLAARIVQHEIDHLDGRIIA